MKLTVTNACIDLHVHSTCSDGLLTPAEIIAVAQRRGLRAISITDHDTVAATPAAVELGMQADLHVVPGIEIGVGHRGCEVHLLGYFIDAASKSLRDYTELLRESREGRAREIVRVLQRQGIKIPYEMVQKKANGAPIGRPHIAQVLLEEGYVFSSYEAFQKYLGEKKAGDIPKLNIGLQRAVQIIKEAGGLAFLAHPVTTGCCEEVLTLLIDYGLDGIETIHPKHTAGIREHYSRIARKYHLLESGGSDCHGRDGEISLGTLDVPYSFLEEMLARISQVRSIQKITT